jgi:hypothetical protein
MTRDVQQLRDSDAKTAGPADVDVDAEHNPEVSRRASNAGLRREVQQKRGSGGASEEQVHAAAELGTATPSQALPFQDRIQASFGPHDVSNVRAHTDARATGAMAAEAYTTGNHVVFGKEPDLHTAAHEAAHVVQQKQGVQLKGGVGAAGDSYERQADEVADHVVAGKSASHLLGPAGGSGGASGQAVQQKAAAKEDPTKAHDLSDSMSQGSAQSALNYLAKQFHTWVPKIQAAMSIDTKGPAGVGPAQNAIGGIFEQAKNDVYRVSEAVLTAPKENRHFLSPEVRKVQGAFPKFYNAMTIASNWLTSHQGAAFNPQEIQTEVDGLPQAIGAEGKLEPDFTAPEGDEKALSKTMIKDQFDALDAAFASVKSGNDKDAGRIDLHLRYLDGIAAEHPAELKSQKPKLKTYLKQVDELRKGSQAMFDKLAEAHHHLTQLLG